MVAKSSNLAMVHERADDYDINLISNWDRMALGAYIQGTTLSRQPFRHNVQNFTLSCYVQRIDAVVLSLEVHFTRYISAKIYLAKYYWRYAVFGTSASGRIFGSKKDSTEPHFLHHPNMVHGGIITTSTTNINLL
jgi:hypothetical protein